MFGLLKRLLPSKANDNGKSLEQVVNELHHTHDLQEVIELLNGLNEKGREGLLITIGVWDSSKAWIYDIDQVASDMSEAMSNGNINPYLYNFESRTEHHTSIDTVTVRLFDLICYQHELIWAKYEKKPDNHLILYVR